MAVAQNYSKQSSGRGFGSIEDPRVSGGSGTGGGGVPPLPAMRAVTPDEMWGSPFATIDPASGFGGGDSGEGPGVGNVGTAGGPVSADDVGLDATSGAINAAVDANTGDVNAGTGLQAVGGLLSANPSQAVSSLTGSRTAGQMSNAVGKGLSAFSGIGAPMGPAVFGNMLSVLGGLLARSASGANQSLQGLSAAQGLMSGPGPTFGTNAPGLNFSQSLAAPSLSGANSFSGPASGPFSGIGSFSRSAGAGDNDETDIDVSLDEGSGVGGIGIGSTGAVGTPGIGLGDDPGSINAESGLTVNDDGSVSGPAPSLEGIGLASTGAPAGPAPSVNLTAQGGMASTPGGLSDVSNAGVNAGTAPGQGMNVVEAGPGGVGDSSGGPGVTVICGELYRQGRMGADVYALDQAAGRRIATEDPCLMTGYLTWAPAVVRLMQRSQVATHTIAPFALAWARHVGGESNWLGAAIMTMAPAVRLIGRFRARGTYEDYVAITTR